MNISQEERQDSESLNISPKCQNQGQLQESFQLEDSKSLQDKNEEYQHSCCFTGCSNLYFFANILLLILTIVPCCDAFLKRGDIQGLLAVGWQIYVLQTCRLIRKSKNSTDYFQLSNASLMLFLLMIVASSIFVYVFNIWKNTFKNQPPCIAEACMGQAALVSIGIFFLLILLILYILLPLCMFIPIFRKYRHFKKLKEKFE